MTMSAASRRVLEFTQHTYMAILATVYPSGGPQAFPVWYDYDGRRFTIATEADTAKVRNINHNPRIALCITDTSRQVKSLTVLGRAEVVIYNDMAQELHRKLSIRYLGQDEGREWADSMADEEMAVIRITPEK
ncbi:MAG: PPOX class F420-dependent oxidoreductase, partial [Dehalococcoidia bacterium]|nr:PPOX class F420-dependent oxidoreductase [Dehalococcoidia bacterium]